MTQEEEIKVAISSGLIDQARSMIRDALQKKDSAELYLLAAQVAVDESQKQRMLEKALALDPKNVEATNLLTAHNPSTVTLANQPNSRKSNKSPTTLNLVLVGGFILIAGIIVIAIVSNNRRSNPTVYSNPQRPVATPTREVIVRSYKVARKLVTDVEIWPGDRVAVVATGNVKVSSLWPPASPDGVSDAAQIWLSDYSISTQFRHGALLCGVTGGDWQLCGKSTVFKQHPASKAGYLAFEVNDDDQGNNVGAFEVSIVVER